MDVGDFGGPGDGVHTKRTGKVKKPFGGGGTFENNRPVGSAGQPVNGGKGEARQSAIERRIAKLNKDRGKK